MKSYIAAVLSLGLCVTAHATPGKFAWQDIGQRLKASQAVAPLGPNMSGEQVSLSNGALSFSATDVSLPGNSALPVAFSRSYVVKNRKDYYSQDMLGDWSVDVPNISGIFTPDWSAPGSNPGARCSNTAPPTPPSGYQWTDYWQGVTIDLPGSGGDMLVARASIEKPTTGGPYLYTTTDGQTHVACLSSIQNGTGEGFIVTTADGTRYWFNRLSQYAEPDLKASRVNPEGTPSYMIVARRKNVMLATRVEDRFGNFVTYTYSNAWNEPAKLTSIAASDGRQITIAYSGAFVASVSDGTHTWTYGYATTPAGRLTLSSVTLPDASAWNIGFAAFTDAEIKYNEAPMGEPLRMCTSPETPLNYSVEPVGTITHPAGATGTFTVGIVEHGRSSVTVNCGHVTTWTGYPPGTGNDTNDDVNMWAISDNSFTLKQKRMSGPGLATEDWNYTYDPSISVFRHVGTTFNYPVCTVGFTECRVPPCQSESCARSSKTTVTGPRGHWTRYSYGNTWRYNEGKLVKVETGTGTAPPLKTVDSTYDVSMVDKVYPAFYGSSMKVEFDGWAAEYHRPLLTTVTQQQAANFIRTNNAFDGFARPLTITKRSELTSAGVATKNEAIVYYDNLAKWVVGQVAKVSTNGIEVVEVGYDSVTGNQTSYESYDKLLQTLTYNADGTVATVTDGNNNITTLSNWYRSVPRSIKHPATPESPTGAIQTAVVNPKGWVTSVTDENGHVTGYGYDAMGRISSIVHPTADSTVWANTTQAFQKVGTTEYGIPAGHWRQTVSTGNARRITYFDGQWRPLLTREYDAADETATRRFQRFGYDHQGRTTFASYPGTTDALTTGSWSEYDALGRVTSSSQDSELGMLTSLTEYLPGLQTRVTPPKGQAAPAGWQTTTTYRAYDQPSMDLPVTITHPAGAVTVITRNQFDAPTALRRQDAANTLGVTRSYTYDVYQRLCRVVEPETGATLMGYDNNNNVAWSASGLPDGTACDAAGTSAAVVARKAARTYDARNRVKTLSFPDGRGNTTHTYTPDSLPATITASNDPNGGAQVINAYTYNKRRMLTGESVQQPGWYSWGLGYGFDANGNQSTLTYPTGLAVNFNPNALGQPRQVNAYATGITYHPNGAVAQFTYGNGLTHVMTQNSRQLPGRTTNGLALDFSYQYDKNANITQIYDHIPDLIGGPAKYRLMEYDGLDRLVNVGSAMFGGDHFHRFTYDALDNIKSWKLGGVKDYAEYVYSPSTHQLTNVKDSGGASVLGFSYDVQGNLTSKNGKTYTFDFGNRLRSTNEEFYRYDGLGRRVLNWRTTEPGVLSQYSQAGQLIYDSNERASGRKATEYIYLAGSVLAKRERNIDTNAVKALYQHTDALGTPVAVTNESGQVIERIDYEPFGAAINKTVDGLGYTGHVQDSATGLTYMQQRYYDPAIGRFLSVDPVTADGNTGGNFNRYWYANNNPYKFTDPDGRAAICLVPGPMQACMAAGAAVVKGVLWVGGAIAAAWAGNEVYNEIVEDAAEPQPEAGKEPIPGAADLVDDLAGQELKGEIEAGGGKVLSGMGDKKFDPETGTHDKVAKSRTNADGTKTELHAEKNRETGKVDDAKIKQDYDTARGNLK